MPSLPHPAAALACAPAPMPASAAPVPAWSAARLATLALLASALAPAAQAGPFEDAFEAVWDATDPAVECADPRTGDCTGACQAGGCVGRLAEEAEGEVRDAAGEAVDLAAAKAAELVAWACEAAGCAPTTAALLALAASALAGAGSAAGAANGTLRDAPPAAANASAAVFGQGFAAADAAVAAARALPRAIDETLPSDVILTCRSLRLGPDCAVWWNRYPLPAVAGAGLLPSPANNTGWADAAVQPGPASPPSPSET